MQNMRSFNKYHKAYHPQAKRLEEYFTNWLVVLVTELFGETYDPNK